MIFFNVLSLLFGWVFCAVSATKLVFHDNDHFEKLLEDVKRNSRDVAVLSEFKFSLDLLYKDDRNFLFKQLRNFMDDQNNQETLQKFTVYSLYHLPPNFSKFEVFEPLLRRPSNENYDVYLALNWLQMAMKPPQLSEADKKEEFTNWIYEEEYKTFVDILEKQLRVETIFNNLCELHSNRYIIEDVLFKFRLNPEYALRMAICEGMPQILPIAIFLYLKPKLELKHCVNHPILHGILNLKSNQTEASWTYNFISQVISELESYDLILISPMFTDVVKGLLQTFFEKKFTPFPFQILI
jgi:hypothetical protein